MKKVLIGTTALVAASMLSLPAMAMHMDEDGNYQVHTGNLSLSIGGYGTFKVEYKSREPKKPDTESYRSHNAEFDSELHFEGSTTLASGTEAGIKIEFETGGKDVDGDDTIDENFIWVEGMLGKVYLGGRDAEELEEKVERTYSGVGLLAADKGENSAKITTPRTLLVAKQQDHLGCTEGRRHRICHQLHTGTQTEHARQHHERGRWPGS